MDNKSLNENVFGLAANHEQAHQAIEALKSAGLRNEQVSFVLMETSTNNESNDPPSLPSYQNRVTSATTLGGITGTSIGAALGWAATLGTAAAGPLVVAGPLLAIISGAVAGGTTGGLLGAAAGASKQKANAEREEASAPQPGNQNYAEHLQRGGVLIVAHPCGRDERATVHQLFDAHGIQRIPEHELNVS